MNLPVPNFNIRNKRIAKENEKEIVKIFLIDTVKDLEKSKETTSVKFMHQEYENEK